MAEEWAGMTPIPTARFFRDERDIAPRERVLCERQHCLQSLTGFDHLTIRETIRG